MQTNFGLVLTLLAVVALGAGYEYIRLLAKKIDSRVESANGK